MIIPKVRDCWSAVMKGWTTIAVRFDTQRKLAEMKAPGDNYDDVIRYILDIPQIEENAVRRGRPIGTKDMAQRKKREIMDTPPFKEAERVRDTKVEDNEGKFEISEIQWMKRRIGEERERE